MKKSLIAFAALATIAGAVSAQSSVTLYGRIDLAVGKAIGTEAKAINNGSGSRLGVRGVEDLGGGMSAFFNVEHRFNADTGAQSAAPVAAGATSNAAPLSRFWTGRSIVGLQGGFGKVTLGREYTTAFLQSQLIADPWGWDTVASGIPGAGLNQLLTGGDIARVRNDSSLTYNFSAAGFSVGAQVAEATDTINNFAKKPFNFALNYAAGPMSLGFGYEKTGQVGVGATGEAAKWMTVNGSFNLGAVKLGALLGKGNSAAGADHKAWMLTAVAPMGQGELRGSYGKLTADPVAGADVTVAKGFAVGYHYALSKRTTVYADYARNTGTGSATYGLVNGEENGYNFGVKHNF